MNQSKCVNWHQVNNAILTYMTSRQYEVANVCKVHKLSSNVKWNLHVNSTWKNTFIRFLATMKPCVKFSGNFLWKCLRKFVFKVLFLVNLLVKYVHFNNYITSCTLECLFTCKIPCMLSEVRSTSSKCECLFTSLNPYMLSKVAFSYEVVQLISHSPVWILICCIRSDFCLNDRLQVKHWNGRSPVWFIICFVRSPFCLKDL